MTQSHEDLSPFEFKDVLIKMAHSNSQRMMLNAGRGNPNFLATMPRHAFLRMGEFALHESERSYSYLSSGFGGTPEKEGITMRFDGFCVINRDKPGVHFLRQALSFAYDHIGIAKDDLLFELANAFLGCNYPEPPRMLSLCETIVKLYISQQLCGTSAQSGEFELFATEGATAAMAYLFQTLWLNSLVVKHDKIAIVTPIFSPYLEVPHLPGFSLDIVELKADAKSQWQVPDSELEKLLDPKVKFLFLVNPSNPPSVKMSDQFLNSIAELVATKRPDLMIISDDVYATFSDNYQSLFAKCPYNTLCVYSFSKYFGVTGWRLGVMALHKENIFNDLLAKIPEKEKLRLDQRYASLTQEPRKLTFLERLVADSRSVALNHTAGISLPQQLQMTLLAFAELLDEKGHYNDEAKRLIRRRYDLLYKAIGITPCHDENSVDYYTLIDLESIAASLYNKEFSKWFIQQTTGSDFTMHLANETGVVLLPGKGFNVDHPSARVSLANLSEFEYRAIGLAVKQLLLKYYDKFQEKV